MKKTNKKHTQVQMPFVDPCFLTNNKLARENAERQRISRGFELFRKHLEAMNRNRRAEDLLKHRQTNPQQIDLFGVKNQIKKINDSTIRIRAKYLEAKGFFVPNRLKDMKRQEMIKLKQQLLEEINDLENVLRKRKRPKSGYYKSEAQNELNGLRNELNIIEFLLFRKKFW